MADPLSLVESLDELDIPAIGSGILESKEEVIADLNATQMSQGKRSDGTDITPSYADLTIELKSQKSGLASVTSHVTLFDTGAHYRELFADVQGNEIEYGSNDEKSEALQKKYGNKIYGLGEDAKDELAEGHLRPAWQGEIEEKTGLKFSK